jgi:DnaK suppressor protein
MNRTEFEMLKAHVRNRISELQIHVEQKSEEQKIDSRADAQAAANPNSVPERELEQKIVEKDRQELMRLQANLLWLESANGGYCEQCGCDIPVERLRVVPVTRLCVNCAR